MFKTKQIKTQILGDKLKNARESLKMTLAEVSKKTKIPLGYLRNLEEGTYKELPADVYVGAYLRKYTEILNLDIDEVLEQFRTERGTTSKSPSCFTTKTPLAVTPKRIGLVLSIIAVALILGYFWHQLSYLINPPAIKIAQPGSDLTIEEKIIEISGQTEPDVYLMVNGQELYVDKRGYFRDIVNLDPGLNILKFEAKDRFGKVSTAIRRIMVNN